MGICCSKNIVVPHGLDNAALIRNSPSTHSSRSVTPYKVEDDDVGELEYTVVTHTPIRPPDKLMKIEDTFWPGKKKIISDFNSIREMDQHVLKVRCWLSGIRY